MKERLTYLAIILGLIILLVLQRECTPKPPVEYVTTSDTLITHDTIIKKIAIKGKDIKVIDTLRFTDTINLTRS